MEGRKRYQYVKVISYFSRKIEKKNLLISSMENAITDLRE
jgi:hypothetical protein